MESQRTNGPSTFAATLPPPALQVRMIVLSYFAYFFYYFTRKHLSVATGSLVDEGFSLETIGYVNSGYAVYDINNRGSSGYGKTFFAMDDRKHGEADLGDVVAAKTLFAGTNVVDTARVAVMGGSVSNSITTPGASSSAARRSASVMMSR